MRELAALAIASPDATAILYPVPSRQVPDAWPEVLRQVERALVHGGGRYAPEDFLAGLPAEGNAALDGAR